MKTVTELEYAEALSTIKKYHEQNESPIPKGIFDASKTMISEWEQINQCSGRLRNVLLGRTHPSRNLESYGIFYIEDITKKNMLKIKNAGIGVWNEFCKLDGKI